MGCYPLLQGGYPMKSRKFVYVGLTGKETTRRLWPGDVWNLTDSDGTPILKVFAKYGAWHIQQCAPFATLDADAIAWAKKQ
jgi:hypothetical protein